MRKDTGNYKRKICSSYALDCFFSGHRSFCEADTQLHKGWTCTKLGGGARDGRGDNHITNQSQQGNVPDNLKTSLNAENHNMEVENTGSSTVIQHVVCMEITQRS